MTLIMPSRLPPVSSLPARRARYLDDTPPRYDLLVIDITDPLERGPSYLMYTQEFYRLARQRLTDGGLLVVQAGPCGPLNYQEMFTAIHHTISTVFPTIAPYRVYIPSFGSVWGFILAGQQLDPVALTPSDIDARLAARLPRPLRFYDGATHSGLFSLPKYLREALAQEERLITRDDPLYAV